MTYAECALSDAAVGPLATGTEQAAVRFGWMMLSVLDQNQTLDSAVTTDGEVTTVVTTRTSQYRVLLIIVHQVSTNDRNFMTVFC